ncbi:uncharacterized protein LOC133841243 [Drosophila sulfurigaster albostrigata]|uniref:uncharacterized protein LOC133841243 n=1 Tax=Drosophila sulfurigaster albostrigata TaxID=89887 RepID=UPI002D21DAAE|nr:uncharacterized protein LOC133841243 [Drosophila sulfurigaster albostrigata]
MADFPKCLSDDSLYEYEQNEKKRLTQTNNPKIVVFRGNVRPSHTRHKLRQRPSQLLHVQQWRDHRHRLKQIASNIDNKPPRYQAARQTGVMGMYNNAIAFMSRTKANMQMLMELSHFLRTRGAIQTFRSDRLYTTSSLAYKIKTLERVEEENLDIAKRLLDVVSQVDTGLKVKSKTCQPPKKTRSRRIKPFTMDEMPLKKYEGYNFEMPQTDEERWLLFRPLIYLDIYLKDSRPLGRIIVELFTEAAPVVVLELIFGLTQSCHCRVIQSCANH